MPPKTKKSVLGQFYTTNYNYILSGFSQPPENVSIIEPFAGNGDLLKFLNKLPLSTEAYDIDPKHEWIVQRDTILNPPDYNGKYVITNPPYLARNKSSDKTIYDMYGINDLYKCFIETLIRANAIGGILIVPLNFISSIRQSDILLRKRFLEKYSISRINIFEEQVFEDTSYAVCSFQFERRNDNARPSGGMVFDSCDIPCYVFPGERYMPNITMSEKNNYTIGGEIYNLPQNPAYVISRATKNTENTECITNIFAKCIDDNAERRISLSISSDKHIDNTENLTERSYATLVIEPAISAEQQQLLVVRFNEYLDGEREKYNSLFLTNYRESNTIARKRISFGLLFQICSYLLKGT